MEKTFLNDLLADDDLENAVAALRQLADRTGDSGLQSEMLIQSGRLEDWKKRSQRGDTSPAVLTEMRNGIRSTLVDLVENLAEMPPVSPENQSKQPPGMTESRFKLLLFGMMVLGNVAAFGCLFILGESAGGFTPGEAATTATMLLSVFAAYFSVMLGEFIAQRNDLKTAVEKRVNRRFQWISMGIVVSYFIAVCSLINGRANGEFDPFIKWLAVLESGFGIFVGQVIYGLFKKQ